LCGEKRDRVAAFTGIFLCMGSSEGDDNVKLIKILPVFLMLFLGAIASNFALAQRHGGGHGGGHGGWHGAPRIGLGFSFGFPLYAPYYAPAPYYYYPPYAYSPAPYYYPPLAAPQEYIEQGSSVAPPSQTSPSQAQGSWWYYCADSKSYYPYVRECPGGWQQISPTPPPGPPG